MVYITSVSVTVDKSSVPLGGSVSVTVIAYLDHAPSSDEALMYNIEFALALNSTSNIINTYTVPMQPSYTSQSYTFSVTFNNIGTYTVYGGARLVSKPSGYTPT